MPEAANATPYAGATQSIDEQARLLNDLVATEGQFAKDIYKQQAPAAQQMLAQRAQEFQGQPDARKAVYDAFIRDAQAATAQHDNTMQRGQQLNQIYMDQSKAAIPALEAENAAFADAQKQQYAAAQAARAQAARGSGGGSKSYESQVREKMGVDAKILKEQLAAIPKTNWTASDARTMGANDRIGDPAKLAEQFGRRSEAAGMRNSRSGKEAVNMAQAVFNEMYAADKSWSETLSVLRQGFDAGAFGAGNNWRDIGQFIALANQERWGFGGMEAGSWGFAPLPPQRGNSSTRETADRKALYAGRSANARK